MRHYKRDFPKSPHRHRVGIAANRHPVSLVNANTISYIDGVQEGKEMEMRVVVYNDGMKWHAQCLEKHVFASYTNIGDLPQLLALTIKIEIERGALHSTPEAPKRYFDMWDNHAAYLNATLFSDEDYIMDMAA